MAVSVHEALQSIEKHLSPVSVELVPIENATGKIAAEEIFAKIALPPFDNSAMDGYALKGKYTSYRIVGKILAGDTHTYTLQDGECIKILTGARVPESCDTVIPQENVSVQDDETILIEKPVPTGANLRRRGEDVAFRELLLQPGDKITSAHIGLLASQGITHIKVFRQIEAAVFASGNELKLHFEQIKEAQIYNSNTPYLLARLSELGCKTHFLGKSEDSLEALKRLIDDARNYDLIVTSGGVSVGEADYTKQAFEELGMEIFFSKVQIKPGKPTTFGKIGNTLVLNLPGNPLAGALNFELFGTFLIHKLSGRKAYHHRYIETTITQPLKSPRPVANMIPGFYDGKAFTPAKKYGPGMVNVLGHCNGFILLLPETKSLKKGDLVKFLPIRWEFTQEERGSFMS